MVCSVDKILIKNLVLLKVSVAVLMYCYVDDLKQPLISVWAELRQNVIDKAIDEWRPKLGACVRAL